MRNYKNIFRYFNTYLYSIHCQKYFWLKTLWHLYLKNPISLTMLLPTPYVFYVLWILPCWWSWIILSCLRWLRFSFLGFCIRFISVFWKNISWGKLFVNRQLREDNPKYFPKCTNTKRNPNDVRRYFLDCYGIYDRTFLYFERLWIYQ